MPIYNFDETQTMDSQTGEITDVVDQFREDIKTPLDRYLELRLQYLEIDKKRKEIKSQMDKEECLAIEYMKNTGKFEIEMEQMTILLSEKVKEAIKIEIKKEIYMDEPVLEGQQSLAEMREMQRQKGQEAAEAQCTVADLLHDDGIFEDQHPELEPESEMVTVPDDAELTDEMLREISDQAIEG